MVPGGTTAVVLPTSETDVIEHETDEQSRAVDQRCRQDHPLGRPHVAPVIEAQRVELGERHDVDHQADGVGDLDDGDCGGCHEEQQTERSAHDTDPRPRQCGHEVHVRRREDDRHFARAGLLGR